MRSAIKKGAAPSILAVLILLAVPVTAQAQHAGTVPRIGALHLGTAKVAAPFIEAFERGLKELGYVIPAGVR
jgi:hypothetical protein